MTKVQILKLPKYHVIFLKNMDQKLKVTHGPSSQLTNVRATSLFGVLPLSVVIRGLSHKSLNSAFVWVTVVIVLGVL